MVSDEQLDNEMFKVNQQIPIFLSSNYKQNFDINLRNLELQTNQTQIDKEFYLSRIPEMSEKEE